jgi:methylmalonyl-CoA/ethylmalonyl-CoA epimerase
MPGALDPLAFKLHHVGIAVPDLQQASAFYTSALGFQIISGPIEDPIQKVRASFLTEVGRDSAWIELICPSDEDSPVNGYLKKGIGAYHVCYEVPDIASALAELRAKGCLVISAPVSAVAFGGRKIAWCFTPTRHLLELLEQSKV